MMGKYLMQNQSRGTLLNYRKFNDNIVRQEKYTERSNENLITTTRRFRRIFFYEETPHEGENLSAVAPWVCS